MSMLRIIADDIADDIARSREAGSFFERGDVFYGTALACVGLMAVWLVMFIAWIVT